MGLKLAHSVVVTPRRNGLYETTRELVAALQEAGVDSRMVDPTRETNTLHPEGEDDRGAPFADLSWALGEADVLINHSGLGAELEQADTPVVHVAHGRPRYSFLSELGGSTPIYSYHYHKNRDPRFRAVVTFWPLHRPYLEVMWPDTPVYCVAPPVDLEAWSPAGPRGYRFNGNKGTANIVVTDGWRDDIDPFVPVNAFALYARKHLGAKLHIYGSSKNKRAWSPLLKQIQDQGNLGEVLPWVHGLDNVYRAADLMISPNAIATRSVREAMACGCPVLQATNVDIEAFAEGMQKARVTDRREVREQAEILFHPAKTAREFLDVVNGALDGRRQMAAS